MDQILVKYLFHMRSILEIVAPVAQPLKKVLDKLNYVLHSSYLQ